MRELNVNEIQEVNGGLIKTAIKVITSGVAYDAIKAVAKAAMEPSGRTSSGGQMNRDRRSSGA